ncbi:MAG: multicopper oxidase family protein [Sciscionella sp.]
MGLSRDVGTALGRRRFLMLGGGVAATAALAACSPAGSGGAGAARKVGPDSPAVAAAECARDVSGAPTVSVALDAAPTEIDLGGKRVSTWAYGGVVPGKEIRVTRGEHLRVDLSNRLPQPTTVHWHGLAIRNNMDGVPNLTQAPVAAGGGFRYEFTVPESGTFWFHPHAGTQLDRGLYGPLIVQDPADGGDYDEELVVVLDDWLDGTGRTPVSVLADLKRNGMGAMGGMHHGGGSMPGMSGGMRMPRSKLLGGDAGDVTYPYYLANGRIAADPQVINAKPGKRYRLRLINAGGDTAFRVGIPGASMTVTHTDGFPVVPKRAESVLLGMAERIDAVVEVPDSSVPLLVVPEGKDGHAQVVFRVGRTPAPDPAALVAPFLARPVLLSTDTVATDHVHLAERKPDVTHALVLEGPGNKYQWTINGKPYNPNRGVGVRQGQYARLRFENQTTMWHPMHLHGHTFQVRGAGGTGPRKDTVIVLPGKTVEVDFEASNPGQWLTHCHNIYHGQSGMMTVLSYLE